MKKRLAVLLLAGILTTILIAGCGSDKNEKAEPEAAGENTENKDTSNTDKIIFKTSTGGETITTFDPTNVMTAGTMTISLTCYEPLVREKIGSTELEPCLATEWETPDNQTFTFKLRENVPFKDGNIMKAEDVVYSYERAMAFSNAASSCVSGIEAVEAPDDKTVVIKLSSPNSGFLYNAAKIGIISKQFCSDNEKDGDYGQNACLRETCGTGAYQISDYKEDQYYAMSRFDDYWGGWNEEHNQIDEIQNILVKDLATEYQMFVSGELDKVQMSLDEYLEELEANSSISVYQAPSLECDIFSMNTQKAPLSNPKIREAVSLAMDYKGVAESVLGGGAQIPHGFLSTTFEESNPNIPEQQFDMEKAKALIEESGETDITIEMHILTIPRLQQMASMLQANLKELGITLNISEKDWLALAEEHTNPETAPDMASLCMGAFTGDAVNYLNTNFNSANSGGSYNWSFYENENFDALMKTAAETADEKEKLESLYQAQELLVKDCPAVFAANPAQIEAINNRWEGFTLHPTNYFWTVRYQDLTLKQ